MASARERQLISQGRPWISAEKALEKPLELVIEHLGGETSSGIVASLVISERMQKT